jgi:hypothetical protein
MNERRQMRFGKMGEGGRVERDEVWENEVRGREGGGLRGMRFGKLGKEGIRSSPK